MKVEGVSLLRKLGFVPSGALTWGGDQVGLELSVFSHSRDRGVYGLVIDEEIQYVGKTGLEFYRRVYSYKNPGPSQQTNIRINRLLTESLPLSSDRKCEIWFLPDERIRQGKLRLQLGDSLLEIEPDRSIVERALISHVGPAWNRE